MLSHIVFKGNKLSKFAACTRSVKAQRSKQSISGSKCKQQVRSASTADVPKNLKSMVRGNWGFKILLKLFAEGRTLERPEVNLGR
jgi:hypothetical protein